ncbi:MAG: hypothetical protein IIA89_12120 [Chloroflexi bacterium]|nr:hypothetical protein [Chloroflexota bacterium]
MGLFKILRVAKAVGDLYSTDKQLEALQKAYRQKNKKFRKHVENCANLQRYPEVICPECEKIAQKTGSTWALFGIQHEMRLRNTPAMMDVFSEDEIIEAALSKWSEDPSREEPKSVEIGNTTHDWVRVSINLDGGWGSVKVEGSPKDKSLWAEEPEIRSHSDKQKILNKIMYGGLED